MKPKFHVGDKVKCIRPMGSLRKHRIYTIAKIKYSYPGRWCLNIKEINDRGITTNAYSQDRFILAFPVSTISQELDTLLNELDNPFKIHVNP